jgi:hypothetical protein
MRSFAFLTRVGSISTPVTLFAPKSNAGSISRALIIGWRVEQGIPLLIILYVPTKLTTDGSVVAAHVESCLALELNTETVDQGQARIADMIGGWCAKLVVRPQVVYTWSA